MNHNDEWRAAQYNDPAANRDDRPDPSDLDGIFDHPLAPIAGCDDCGSDWPKPLCNCDHICGRCQRNETRRRGQPCGECVQDMEQEEACDRSRAGEWHG